ncbi:MAG: hypothetical protein J6J57_01725 [Alistipes sp.]|nr:hypothetical protein [Alistipes sp.]
MKNFRLLMALVALAMFAPSCQQFQESDPMLKGKARFTAYLEESSRTTMGEDYSVLWSAGDQIAMAGISADNSGYIGVYDLVEGAGTTKGVFEGNLTDQFDKYFAFYPVSMFKSANSSGLIVMDLPQERIFAERNFIDEANPMVASGTQDGGLQFLNVFGILELQIKGEGTINSILIQDLSAEPSALSGTFYVLAESAASLSYEGYPYVEGTLDTPIELSATEARSIYAVLPLGEYNNLYIQTTDASGVATVRMATKPIVIERSKITSVSEFEHKEDTTPSVVTTYLPDESNFYSAYVLATLRNAEMAQIATMPESQYKELVGQGLSDIEIVEQYANKAVKSLYSKVRVDTYSTMGETIYVLAAPFDADGNALGKVFKSSFVAKTVPIDSSYSTEISGEPEITSNSFQANFKTEPMGAVFRASIYTSEQFATIQPWQLDIYTATEGAHYTESSLVSDTITLLCEGLTPNTEYKLVYRVASGVSDGVYTDTYTAYSEYKVYTFKTAEYVKSDATVTLSMAEVKDWSATVNLSSTNALKYKLYLSTGGVIEAHEVDLYGIVVHTYEANYTCTGLKENTKYYLSAVAYDGNDIYGEVSSIEFTTTDLVPESGNAEYAKFLGTYTFSSQNGAYDNEPRTVTISQAIDGKTFHIKGLLHPTAMANFQISDDTMVAKFYDNMIHVGGALVNSGEYVTSYGYSIYADPCSEQLIWPGQTILSPYNNGELVFSCLSDSQFTGLYFYYGTGVGQQGGAIDYYTNLVLTKVQEGGEQLENPVENPETGW